MKSFEQFLNDLAARESQGRYTIVNILGFLGKYQMGELAFIDADYYGQRISSYVRKSAGQE